MKLLSLRAAAFSSLLSSILAQTEAGSDGWHLDVNYILVNEALDPIVSPNGQASHMHKIMGGSNFGASFNYATQVASSCSSVGNQADNSAYWMPALYWMDNSTRFIPVPSNNRFYYFVVANSTVPFPDGLRMLVGDPNSKSVSSLVQFTCQTNPDYSGFTGTDFNFARDCPTGMKTEVYFPQCWDGLNLYKSDGSHMTYVVGQGSVRDGLCPWSHPVRLPTILLEQTWQTSYYYPGKKLAGNMVWANGDTTGHGIHADFIAAWKPGVLAAALKDRGCVGLGGSIPQTACPTLNQYINNNAASACRPALGTLTEPNGGNTDMIPISRLPGCNLPWASGAKPTCSPAVAPLDVTPFKGTDGSLIAAANQQVVRPNPTTPGWVYTGCVNSASSILGGTSYNDANLSATQCKNACLKDGYAYAGVGQTGSYWTCQCGSSISPSAPDLAGYCNTPCPGNSSETCGASYTYGIFYAPSGTVPTGSAYDLGCYQNPYDTNSGLRGNVKGGFYSATLTTTACTSYCATTAGGYTWAATLGGTFCFCGVDLLTVMKPGSFVPDSFCTTKCGGDASKTCGDAYNMNVYNLAASGAPAGSASGTSTVASTVASTSSVATSTRATTSAAGTTSSAAATTSSTSVRTTSTTTTTTTTSARTTTTTTTTTTSRPATTSSAAATTTKATGGGKGLGGILGGLGLRDGVNEEKKVESRKEEKQAKRRHAGVERRMRPAMRRI